MGLGRFIDRDKCTTLMQDFDNGGGCVCVGPGYVGIPVPSAQFYCESKTAIKISLFFKKLKWKCLHQSL